MEHRMTADPNRPRLPVSYFAANRNNLFNCLGEESLAILTSGRAPHRTADEDYPHWTNRSFFYLAGLDQADAVLALHKTQSESRAVLFIPETDPMYERWRGHRATPEEAGLLTGIAEVRLLSGLPEWLESQAQRPGLNLWLDESARDGQAAELKQQLAERHGGLLARAQNLEPFLIQLRMVKREDELAMLDRAIELTDRGIRAMLRRLEPGQMEYEVWAEFDHALAKEGCLSPAFASIVASGKNIFCLHYMQPYGRIQDGDLVQVDVGAWVGGLCADISRVFPANGRFTASQAALYDVVRQCQETAFATIQPGTTLAAVNEACRQTARQGLLKAGLMQPDEAITDYFWHNVSHHLGLDVHDVANREALLLPGMVLTVEPGIYIPARNMGMRIEDDVVVTKNGCRVLSHQILREAAEIEDLMAESKR